MNREIKFRVWHEGKFHKNVQVRFYSGISGWEYGYSDPGGDIHTTYGEEEGAIIQQYTGLKDQNGEEIYEGDILDLSENNELSVALVEYIDDGFKLVGKDYFGDDLYPHTLNGVWGLIIGNIYENPELLEEYNE